MVAAHNTLRFGVWYNIHLVVRLYDTPEHFSSPIHSSRTHLLRFSGANFGSVCNHKFFTFDRHPLQRFFHASCVFLPHFSLSTNPFNTCLLAYLVGWLLALATQHTCTLLEPSIHTSRQLAIHYTSSSAAVPACCTRYSALHRALLNCSSAPTALLADWLLFSSAVFSRPITMTRRVAAADFQIEGSEATLG